MYRFHHQSSSELARFKGPQSAHRGNIILPTERSTFQCRQDNGTVVQRIFHIIPQTSRTRVSTFPSKPTGHLEQPAAVHSPTHEISLSSRVSLHSYYRGFQAHCEASLTPTLYGITARSSRQVRVQFRARKTFGFSPMSQSSSHPRTQHCFVYISSSIILVSHSLLPPPKRHLQGLKLEAHRAPFGSETSR